MQRKRRNSSCRGSKDGSAGEQDGSLFVSTCKGGVEVFRFSLVSVLRGYWPYLVFNRTATFCCWCSS